MNIDKNLVKEDEKMEVDVKSDEKEKDAAKKDAPKDEK